MRRVALLIMILLMPLDGFAGEEHRKHEQHRHSEYAMINNPIAKTETSIVQGGKLYEAHCMVCHGKTGKGALGPDLTLLIRIHGNTDDEMFHVITDGVAGTAMKGFGKELSDEMRWPLANYIARLQRKK